jgi:hypothetical protein
VGDLISQTRLLNSRNRFTAANDADGITFGNSFSQPKRTFGKGRRNSNTPSGRSKQPDLHRQ